MPTHTLHTCLPTLPPAAFSVTPERKEKVYFVPPYYYSAGMALFAPGGSIPGVDSWAELEGKSIAVREGESQPMSCQTHYKLVALWQGRRWRWGCDVSWRNACHQDAVRSERPALDQPSSRAHQSVTAFHWLRCDPSAVACVGNHMHSALLCPQVSMAPAHWRSWVPSWCQCRTTKVGWGKVHGALGRGRAGRGGMWCMAGWGDHHAGGLWCGRVMAGRWRR